MTHEQRRARARKIEWQDFTPEWWASFHHETNRFLERTGKTAVSLGNAVQSVPEEEDKAYAMSLRRRLLEWTYRSMRDAINAAYLARCLRGEAKMAGFEEDVQNPRIADDLLFDVGRLLVEASREPDIRAGLFRAFAGRVY